MTAHVQPMNCEWAANDVILDIQKGFFFFFFFGGGLLGDSGS